MFGTKPGNRTAHIPAHTPGPLQTCQAYAHEEFEGVEGIIFNIEAEYEPDHYAPIGFAFRSEDAELFAASPGMLVALRAVYHYLVEDGASELAEAVGRAISQATGEVS